MNAPAAATPRDEITSIAAISAPAGRNDAIDFAKGMLVACMVVYHSLNYTTRPELGFRFLAFLPPSFVVITGYLIRRVYFQRPPSGDSKTRSRLVTRALKLLALFTGLNLVIALTGRGAHGSGWSGLASFADHAFDIYLRGSARWASFDILVPIGQLLILACPLLILHRRHPVFIPVLAATMLLVCIPSDVAGFLPSNVAMLGAGILGVALAAVSNDGIDRFARRPFVGIGGYLAYFAVERQLGQSYALQLLGSVAALLLFYAIGLRSPGLGWLGRQIRTWGTYSLLAYIAQIAVLQLLVRVLGRPHPGSPATIALLCLTLLGTAGIVSGVDSLRRRLPVVDRGYRWVFG